MHAPIATPPVVISAGVYILDILGRPISALPTTQNSSPIEEIRLTVAGTAGGTAVDMAALGARVLAVGAIGDDLVGDFVTRQLQRAGVDTTYLAVLPGVATSATILPIHPDGSRPAWHVAGANRLFAAAHIPVELFERADALHLGGLGALPALDGADGADSASLARRAHEAGLLVTADCLGVKRPDVLHILRSALPFVDVFMPNDLEAMAITGATTPLSAAHALKGLGAKAVLVTTGADGMVGVDEDGEFAVGAHTVEAVDSSGCGDAFSAGVIVAMLAQSPLRDAVEYGIAAAALTVQGLGSDGGRLTPERVATRLIDEGRHAGAGIRRQRGHGGLSVANTARSEL